VFGRVPACAVEFVAGEVVAVAAAGAVVVASREGAVGVIWDEVVVVVPAASAPAGAASATPIHVVAAANLKGFTGPENVDEQRLRTGAGEIVRSVHAFSSPGG
jgi:hypothetical protein